MKNVENKTFLSHYSGAFEQLLFPGRGAFASLFSRNPKIFPGDRPEGWRGGGHCWSRLTHSTNTILIVTTIHYLYLLFNLPRHQLTNVRNQASQSAGDKFSTGAK